MHKLVTLAVAAMLGIALSACGATSPAVPGSSAEPTSGAAAGPTSDTMTEPTSGTTASNVGEITINDIQAAANDYYGQNVTVNGDVGQVYNELAFTVSDTSAAAGPLLVITPNSVSVSPGESVKISGTVQQLNVEQIQQDLGITLSPNVADLAGQPVLIADQING